MGDEPIYGYSDIQRYLRHKMSAPEMHDFEKALMNDPFLADALEGFLAGDETLADKHLSDIESELTDKKKKAKVVALPLQEIVWWKVAAVVLVITTGAIFTYSLLTKTRVEKNVAQQITPEKAAEMAKLTDSIGPVEKTLAQVEVLPKKKSFKNKKNGSPIIYQPETAASATMKSVEQKAYTAGNSMMNKSVGSPAFTDSNSNSYSNVAAVLKVPANPAAYVQAMAAKRTAIPSDLLQNEFKGKIKNETGNPLQDVQINAVDRNMTTLSDEKGYFSLKTKDSVLQVSAGTIGYITKDVTIKSNTPINIVLKRGGPTLSEVIVTSKEDRRKADFKRLEEEKNASGAEPADGWENFEQYVKRQTDSLKASDNDNQYNENIELEFSLDNNGRPADIKPTEKADTAILKKAIKILTNGPKWKNKRKNKKTKVIIPFK